MLEDLLFKSHWWIFAGIATILSWVGAVLSEGSVVAVAIAGTVTGAAGAVTVYRKYVSDNIRFLRKSLWQLTRSGIDAQSIVDQLQQTIEWGAPPTLVHLKNKMVYGLHRETTSPYTLRWANLAFYLPKARLEGVNLAGFDLRRAIFVDARLDGANLQGVDLREARLDGAVLKNADLRGANLEGATLIGADIEGAIIDSTTVFPNQAHPYGDSGLSVFVSGQYVSDDQWQRPDWRNW